MSSAAAPTPDHAGRRARVVARLDGLDALFVTGRSNVRYLTGFSGSAGSLLVPATGPPVLATDGRYASQARREVAGLDGPGDADPRLVVTRDDGWLPPALVERGIVPGRIGVEAEHLTLARTLTLEGALPEAALQPVRGIVEELRAVKDIAELAVLRRACTITAGAFAALCGWLAPGLTEREVAHRLLGELLVRGADGPAFDFIVAAGRAGAEPHHAPTAARLQAGDLVTVDAGARLDGYHADMTRTLALGRPSRALAELHAVVARAQAAGVAASRAGATAAAVDAAAREVVEAAGHGARFTHPTGHGVGLDVHEAPILHARQTATLRAGAAITVEPGIYVPGLGGVRIEDVVVVTASGREVLTGSPTQREGHTEVAPAGAPVPPTGGVTAHELIVL